MLTKIDLEHDPEFTAFDLSQKSHHDIRNYIRKLEQSRTVWAARIQRCQERECMYKQFVSDMANLLAQTFQQGHDAVSTNAARATEMIEAIKRCMRKLDTDE